MRAHRLLAAMLLAALVSAGARPAHAEESQDRRGRPGVALVVTGAIFGGLGVTSMFASSLAWVVSRGEAARLPRECPHHRCVEGTPGADALESARDARTAASVLFAVGLPMATAGIVLAVYGGGLHSSSGPRIVAAPTILPGGAGAHVDVRF